ncbi:hypothetical protein ACFQ4L_08390 [Lapidilactobacillus mulanensis]|uniref:Uncharacterized protein n=1 Tax=Lapidilactobacillus mulanensis TaxID=2485999 RepID=A0ABW4DS56_9LACO|nr:hypothetical protein [Lapidilactobacillus mulanensis]
MSTKQVLISNYREEHTAHAFLEFYLALFRSGELDSLSTLDHQNKVADINFFLIDATARDNAQLLDILVARKSSELQTLYDEIAKAEPAVNGLNTVDDWHQWYLKLTNKIAIRTAGSSWNKNQTR